MSEHLVIGAAIINDGRLLLAKRISSSYAPARWEIPGDEMAPDEDEQATLRRVFAVEFSMFLGFRAERILNDRWMSTWRVENGESVPANIRLLRCGIDNGTTINMEAGEPRPNRLVYDESRWVPLDELHDVYPWCNQHDILADELANLYNYNREMYFPS
ncbi:NUDIX domain-containing protein [Amycolatopsis sp. H20-H5]|uniref:NUDIX domain-containing protein n=1 Tax=Amycolatopsis sp. H20-H5 TaxID=3046309 RepID=UPI002DBC1A36|nr:NUDIX domain-containing protein [Amycolatopsis sp. H20-H5]MEC3978751.1 NUDIX domain-containing protein [Amycolatopsis sp. H20-H5]